MRYGEISVGSFLLTRRRKRDFKGRRYQALGRWVEAAIKANGGKLEAFYFAFGKRDAYLIVDVPDHVSVVATALVVNASGAATAKTTVLFDARRDRPSVEEVRELHSAWPLGTGHNATACLGSPELASLFLSARLRVKFVPAVGLISTDRRTALVSTDYLFQVPGKSG